MARTPPASPRRRSYLFAFLRGVLMAEFLLLATWNRTGYSYVGWVSGAASFTALMAVAGISLLIAHLAMLRMTYVALTPLGIAASLVVIGAALLAGSTLDLLNLASLARMSDFWILIAACVLSAGINWAKIQARLSGQRSVLKAPP